MASSPSYGDRPPLQGYRRSFTVPHKTPSLHDRAALDRADAAAEILYSHPSARILSFKPPPESILSNSDVTLPDTDYPVDTVETLPWRSRTETLMATGPFIIEKVRGSTNFLKSGMMMHAILRNSQCWCVDGESKFVLRVRKLTYYRIELPSTTTQDKEKVEELKTVLAKILRFERSPCPFKRAFHVELSDDAITPRRKGVWKPKEGRLSMTSDTEFKPLRRTKNSRAWSMQLPSSVAVNGDADQRLKSDFGFQSSVGASPRQQFQKSEARSMTPASDVSREEFDADDVENEESESGSSVGGTSDDAHKLEDQDLESELSLHEVAQEDHDESVIKHDPQEKDNEDEGPPSAVVEQATEVNEVDLPTNHKEDHEELHTGPVDHLTSELETTFMKEDLDNEIEVLEQEPADIGLSNAEIKPESSEDIETQDNAVCAELPEYHAEPATNDQAGSTQDSSIPDPVELANATDRNLEVEDKAVVDVVAAVESPALSSDVLDHHAIVEPAITEKAEEMPPTVLDTDIAPEDTKSFVSSVDSFHTLESDGQESSNVLQDLNDLPVAERYDPAMVKDRQHRRELSEVTVTASTGDDNGDQNELDRFITSPEINPDKPATPTLTRSSASDTSWPDIMTPSSVNIQDGLRQRQKSTRSISPLPASSNILTQPKGSQGSHLTSAILQKACTVALVKPFEVVVLFVHILVRIAGGATVNDLLSGELFRKPEQHRRNASFPDRVTTHRDNNDDDDDDERDVDEEDDYGVPLEGRRKASTAGKADGNDTDADSIFDLD